MKIYIDAGHNYSGADTGAIGNGLREQDITFYVSTLLKEYLTEAGFTVKCSRNYLADNVANTLNRSINYRWQEANAWNADYFISLHCDASDSTSAKGTHICVYNKGTTSEQLANSIIPYLLNLGLDGRANKIIERHDLAVLTHTNMPAILIEMGFITNPDNAKLMQTPNALAHAIFTGIYNFIKGGNKVYKEYVSTTEAIAILKDKGIITDADKWYSGTWTDNDFKWLLRKVGTYIRDN